MDNFLSLSQSEKKKILMECFLKLKDVGLNQTREIKKYMNNEEMAKNSAHILLQELVIGFWRDVQFIQRLGNNRFKGYATSIARMAFDKCIRLIYLTKQKSPKDQDRLAELELMRTSRKFYFIELNNGEEKNAKKWKDFYNLVKRNTDEEVDASDKKIKSFLDTKSMLQKSQFSDWEKVYINYGFLCEDIHGGLFNLMTKREINDTTREYNMALMFIIRFMREVVVLTDFHFQTNSSKSKLQECENILQKAGHPNLTKDDTVKNCFK